MVDQINAIAILIFLHLIAAAYASALLTRYLVYEDGPNNVFANFRYWAGVNKICLLEPFSVNDDTVFTTYESVIAAGIEPSDFDFIELGFASNGSFWGDVFSCHRCAVPYVTFVTFLTLIFLPLFYLLATSGLALYLIEKMGV